ncbi:hypothetical protein AMECASPLE_037028, partial [Ameca splendens]
PGAATEKPSTTSSVHPGEAGPLTCENRTGNVGPNPQRVTGCPSSYQTRYCFGTSWRRGRDVPVVLSVK